MCLLGGTVYGALSWRLEALLHLLVLIPLFMLARRLRRTVLVTELASTPAALVRRSMRDPQSALRNSVLGGVFEPLLALFFALLAAGTLGSACAARSWLLLLLFLSAACVFYLVLRLGERSREFYPVTAGIATAAALWGLASVGLHRTATVAAPLGHHNYMAGFLVLHLPITFAAAAGFARSLAARVAWRLCALVQLAALLFTGSLAGIGCGILIVVAGIARPWMTRARIRRPAHLRRAIAGTAAAVVLMLLAGVWMARSSSAVIAGARHRLVRLATGGADPSLSLENRGRYWQAALAMSEERPLTGFSPGSTPFVSAAYREQSPGIEPQGETIPELHNLPANILGEAGWLGLALAIALLLLLLRAARGPAALAVVVYLIFALSDYQLDLPAILLPLAVVCGLACAPGAVLRMRDSMAVRAAAWALAAALFAGIVLFGKVAVAHAAFSHGAAATAASWDSRCGFYTFQYGLHARDLPRNAINAYVSAAQQAPDLIPFAEVAGASLADAGRWEEARPWLERAASLDYYFTLAHFHLGRARLHLDDRDGAIEAFATSFLVQPATVMAEAWYFAPERSVYQESLERAIDRLSDLVAAYPRAGSQRQWDDLATWLIGRRHALPRGPYRIAVFEWLDRDPGTAQSVLIFRRDATPAAVAPVSVLLPNPTMQPPAGIGSIRGLPSIRASDVLESEGRAQ